MKALTSTKTKNLQKQKFRFPIYLLLIAISSSVSAVQLENWRLPYYQLASRIGLDNSLSPSGLFWDDFETANCFDPFLWVDTTSYHSDHWTIEPSVAAGYSGIEAIGQRPGFGHVDILNDIRYRNLLVRQTMNADSRYDYDSYYPAHHERAVRARIEEAYVQLAFKYGFFRLGRLSRNWGPFPDHSLLLSNNPYTYDAFEWQVHSSLFEFRHLFSLLPENSQGGLLDDNKPGRFLSAHALNLILGKLGSVGIFESVLFTRDGKFPDLQYVNPISIYTVVNTNQEGDGNLMLGFQWKLHPMTDKIGFYGQLALDDFQVDNEIVTDKEPAHYGLDMAAYWRNPLQLKFNYAIEARYTRTSEWLYTVPDRNADKGERYTYAGKSLGYPSNDGDKISGSFIAIGRKYWAGAASLSYLRKGSRDVTSRWLDNTDGNIGGLPFDYKEGAFPSGIVERTYDFTLDCYGYYNNYVDGKVSFSNRWIKNKANKITTSYEYNPSLSLTFNVHYSNFFVHLKK